MIISDSRVKSVLRTYAKHLRQTKLPKEKEANIAWPSGERVTISEEAKKRLVFERLTQEVIEHAKVIQVSESGNVNPESKDKVETGSLTEETS